MMNHKELFLRAARRNVFQSRFVLLKNSLAKPSCRYLSSVSPLLDDGDHHEDIPREQWMRKKRAMIPTTKELKHRASAALVAVAAPVVDDSSKVDNDSVKNDTNTSPTELTYTGNTTMPITTQLHVVRPGEDTPSGVWPVFRLMVSQIISSFRPEKCHNMASD